MKKIAIYICLLFICFSCNKDDAIEETEVTNYEKPLQEEQEISQSKSTITVGGTTYQTGMGFSLTEDRFYEPAIDNFDMFKTNPPVPLTVEVTTIATNEDLEEFVKKSETVTVNVFFGLFKRKRKKEIQERIKISNNNISVIARISVQSARWLTSGAPFLNAQAQQLVDLGLRDAFKQKYGPMYVSDHIVGGDVYYVYNYDVSNKTREQKSNFKRNIEDNMKYLFGIGGRLLSNQEKEEINRSVETFTVSTNIVGYNPPMIQNVGEVEGQISAIQSYLATNPNNAASLEMVLNPYTDFFDDNIGMGAEYNKHRYYFHNWLEWREIYDRAVFVRNYLLETTGSAVLNTGGWRWGASSINTADLAESILQEVNMAEVEDPASFSPYYSSSNPKLRDVETVERNLCGANQYPYTNSCPWDY